MYAKFRMDHMVFKGIVNSDHFFVRWEGNFDFKESTQYGFAATTDDGMRVYLDGRLIIDAWKNQTSTIYPVSQYVEWFKLERNKFYGFYYPNETLTGIHVKLKDENGFEVQNGYEVISPLYHDEDDKRDVMWEQYVWGFYCDSDHDGEYDDRLDNHFSTRWVGIFDFGYTKYKCGRQNSFLDGKIDEVQVWYTARSQSDIQNTIYQSLTGPYRL